MLMLLTFSCLGAAPAHARIGGNNGAVADESEGPLVIIPTVNTSPYEPAWAVVFPAAQGNYPGGNELFSIFVVDSSTAQQNLTIDNMTLTAPFGTNSAIGLPTILSPGQSVLATIYLPIPTNITEQSFTANLVVRIEISNVTGSAPATLTGSTIVYLLALPGQTTSQSSTSQTGTSGAVVSATLFYIGLGVTSTIAIVLAAVLIMRGRPNRMTPAQS
jgi:hypothetical protein